ncbi:MAG: 6-phosphogluconate dehydrogenase [Firmicutes bacterium HGW-Firmicutes-1]|jgi:NADH dehydrogenase|nr:MAG: 6-phosphogluconate dehydrogenase [Firmicutes bacterium HGW-Firmicutes-1]
MDEKRIVILGGGYAGTFAGKLLHKKFKKEDSVSITLIDKKPYHTLMTELHEVAGSRTEEDSVKVDLKQIFAGRKVDVVLDEIVKVDFNSKVISSKDESYSYDYLIIGAGAEPCCFGIEGVKENAFSLWSFEDAVKIREHIRDMFRLASKEKNIDKRKELLTFVVVGAGFTGVEMIGELGEWKRQLCKEYNIDLNEVRLVIMDALGRILPTFPEGLANKALRKLKRLKIEVFLNSPLSAVSTNGLKIGTGEEISSHTVIWAAGVQSSEFVGKLGVSVGPRGRAKVNEYMQSVDHESVYFIGDNSYFEEDGKSVPQIVEAAHQTAETAVHNIHADIYGKEKEAFKSNIRGFMVSVGSRYGVANLGAKNPMALSGWIAMFVKHMINMLYLFTISGFNRVWTYAMHEFFHIKGRRSFVGGHLAKASPNFWLFPLRLFLGVMWLIEGLNKIPRVLKNPNDIFLIPQPVVDGATAASAAWEGAAEEAVAEVIALPVPEFIESIVAKSMEMFFYTPDGGFTTLATIFQTGMVIAEIVVGLMLIGGLFTAFGSVLSIFMCLMIWSSGMAPEELLWFGISAIALIGGSGSTLGLDYYVLPWLKGKWKKLGIVKKWYLYID